MCGRFSRHATWEEYRGYLTTFVPVKGQPNLPKAYNIAPSQDIHLVRNRDGEAIMDVARWGLFPHWAKKEQFKDSSFPKPINATIEKVATSGMFKLPLKRGRCLALADGYYEWKGPKGNKQPYYIYLPDNVPFVFAGLCALWRDPDDETNKIFSTAVMTMPAAEATIDLHPRMPIILNDDAIAEWIDTDNDDPVSTLSRNRGNDLIYHPVGKAVGKVQNQGPELIAPIGAQHN